MRVPAAAGRLGNHRPLRMTRAGETRNPPASARLPLPADPGRSGWPWSIGAEEPEKAPGRFPRITIVVPSYNQGRFLEATLRSVLLQGYPDLELMVIDGGSSDGSVAIIRRYEKWLAHWVSEPDRGQTHAINKGLERATGEIFSYLNSDDLLCPGALFSVVRALEENPEVDFVFGRCEYVDRGGDLIETRTPVTPEFSSYLRIWKRLEERTSLTQPEVFGRTKVFRSAGPFREDLFAVMDFEMWLRVLQRGHRFLGLDVPLAQFRVHAGQKSESGGLETCQVVEEYLESARLSLPASTFRRIRAELPLARAYWTAYGPGAGAWPEALGDLARAVARDPSLALSRTFWHVLGRPFRSLIPRPVRSRLRRAAQGARTLARRAPPGG
jgi:hypothetical protein